MSTNEGGIRCPCIIRYPPLIPLISTSPALTASSTTHAFTTVMDITPTILALASIPHPYPHPFQSRTIVPLRGKSWVLHLSSPSEHPAVYSSAFDFAAWELFGNRAVRRGRWKAVLQAPPKGTGAWELYDLEADPGEIVDLAGVESQRERLRELVRCYEVYYQETGMFDAGAAIEEARRKVRSVGGAVERAGLHGFRGR